MTTTTIKTLEIKMSERRPVKIVVADWPIVASAHRHNGTIACQANYEWDIIVREHADGRRLVYGWLRRGPGGVRADWRGSEGGFLLPSADSETIRAIRRIGGIIGDEALADECIADLSPEAIS